MLNFAPQPTTKMLNIEEAYHIMGGSSIGIMWEGWIACETTDKRSTFTTNLLERAVSCFSFTLVRQGYVSLIVGDKELIIHPNELFIYLPGFPIYKRGVRRLSSLVPGHRRASCLRINGNPQDCTPLVVIDGKPGKHRHPTIIRREPPYRATDGDYT